jgi:uncharacterized membrane protein HdeD (DUF308 family)
MQYALKHGGAPSVCPLNVNGRLQCDVPLRRDSYRRNRRAVMRRGGETARCAFSTDEMETHMAQLDRLERAVLPGTIGHHWWSYIVEGVLLVLLGVAAILVPIFASIAFAFFLGVILLASGVIGVTRSVIHPHAPGLGWALLSATISIIAGLLLIAGPVRGALSLTFVLAAYLFVEGVASIAYAWSHRGQLAHGWGWMVFNGVIDLVMAAVVVWVMSFLFVALWVLGLFIGIDFIVGGISLIRMGTVGQGQQTTGAARQPLSNSP